MTDREWNEMIGLRSAAISLVFRSIAAAIVWALATWLLLWFGSRFPLSIWLVIIVGSLAGAPIGILESRGLTERAGLSSILITALACVFVAGSIIGSSLLIEFFTVSLPDFTHFLFWGSGIVVAGLLVIRYTMLDE